MTEYEFEVRITATGYPDHVKFVQHEDKVEIFRDAADLEDVHELGPENYEAFLIAIEQPSGTSVIEAVRKSLDTGKGYEVIKAFEKLGVCKFAAY